MVGRLVKAIFIRLYEYLSTSYYLGVMRWFFACFCPLGLVDLRVHSRSSIRAMEMGEVVGDRRSDAGLRIGEQGGGLGGGRESVSAGD